MVQFRKLYFHILLKRKFLAKPRYATFLKIALKIAYYGKGVLQSSAAGARYATFFFRHAACSFSGKIENCLLHIEFCRG